MPVNVEIADNKKEQNPMLGLIGFIIMVVVGGISFLISGPLTRYLTTAHLTVGMTGLKLLPVKFPPDWSPLAGQLAVAFGVFLVVFVFSMLILFIFMKPPSKDEMNVDIDILRKEVEARKKVR